MKALLRSLFLVTALGAALLPHQAKSWGTLTGKVHIPAYKETFMRQVMIRQYALDPARMTSEFEDRRGPHPIHQFIVYQAFLRLAEDPAYKDGLSGFPTGKEINSWDGIAHTDHGMRGRTEDWPDNLSESFELSPNLDGVRGPSADAEIVGDSGYNKEYNGRAHYWNPFLHDGAAPVTAAANYVALVRAVLDGADTNTKAHYASYMAHYLADVASAKHADAFTLDEASVQSLIPIAHRFMADRSDELFEWMKSTAIDDALAVLKARTRQLNPSTSGEYWTRVDSHIERDQLFVTGDHTGVGIYPKCLRASVAAYLHELDSRPEGKSLDQFYTYFDPFYFNGHIFNRGGDWPSFELSTPSSDHLQWETNPAHYTTAMKYMGGDKPTIMPFSKTGTAKYGKFEPASNFYSTDWKDALDPMEQTVSDLVQSCSEAAHGAITSEQDFQPDPTAHMEQAIRYVATAFRASITALRLQSSARMIGSTGSFKLDCTVRNLSDHPATLKSLRLVAKKGEGPYLALPGWTFDVGGKRATSDKPFKVSVVGKKLPEGYKIDDLYVEVRGEIQGEPDCGWRRAKVGEREMSIVKNPTGKTELVKKAGPVDVVVVLDTTGSMQGSIDSMRENAIRSIQRLQGMTNDIRMAITTFRDLGEEDDRGHFIVKGFTRELENQYNLLRDLTADGGGDTPEDQLYGVSKALELWEKEGPTSRQPTKVVIVITDAPAKSPDSKGNTFKSIAKRAIAVDPAHIYPIVVGSDSKAMEHAKELADSSGGKVLSASTADKVADSILEAVQTAVTEHGGEPEEPDRPPLGLTAAFILGSGAFLYGAFVLIGAIRR